MPSYLVTSYTGTGKDTQRLYRTKSSALKEYVRRYNRGDRWIELRDHSSGEVLRKYSAKTVSPAKANPHHRGRRHGGRTNPTKYKITTWHGEGRSLFYVLRGGTVVKTFHRRDEAEKYIASKTKNPRSVTLNEAKRVLPKNRLTDVLVKSGGKVFKAKAKYDPKLGRVRVFANPRVARAVNPELTKRWTISAIRAANKEAGYHFFDRSALRFFNSKVFPTVYQGPGGIYFVTSETMQPEIPSLKRYTVRKFLPETANVHSAEQFRDLTSAKVSARMASRG